MFQNTNDGFLVKAGETVLVTARVNGRYQVDGSRRPKNLAVLIEVSGEFLGRGTLGRNVSWPEAFGYVLELGGGPEDISMLASVGIDLGWGDVTHVTERLGQLSMF